MSDSVRPHPWDSPGKNTGVGCHFLLLCRKVKSESEVAQSCPTLRNPRTAAYQAPPFMGFSRQEYRSGVPLPSPLFLQVSGTRCVGASPPAPTPQQFSDSEGQFNSIRTLFIRSSQLPQVTVPCFPGSTVIKNPPASAGDGGDVGSVAWSGEFPGAGMATLSSIHGQSGKFCGQRSLADCSPWGHKESDTTEYNTATQRDHLPLQMSIISSRPPGYPQRLTWLQI